MDRDISDLLRRLDRYASARAADLLERGEIGTLGGNLRRFVSRFLKCYVSRGGWREGGWGVLIALCAGLYPLLAHLKARLEPERHRPCIEPQAALPQGDAQPISPSPPTASRAA